MVKNHQHMAGWFMTDSVTHILGKSQDPNRWQVNHWPIRKKEFQSTIGLPMAFGEAMKICWLPVIYGMGSWPSITANMETQLSQHSWRKKHVGLNTTLNAVFYHLLWIERSTFSSGTKDETDERINLERLPHHPYHPLCDWNAYRRVSEWEMKQA